jgi:competence protein ComEA
MNRIVTKGLAAALILGVLVFPLLAQQASQAAPPPAGKSAADKININAAALDELQKLPGIGPKIAQRIIDYRKQNGNFKKVEDLMKVRGIGEKTFLKMKDQLTI